jgi:uncharacterized membrane protein
MNTLCITFLLSGMLIFVVCLPIVHGIIPMNKFYGMRTKDTFKSDESWLHLNEVGGMIFAMIGFPLILAGVVGFFIPEQFLQIFSTMVLIVTFLSIAAALYFFTRYSKRYTRTVEQAAP